MTITNQNKLLYYAFIFGAILICINAENLRGVSAEGLIDTNVLTKTNPFSQLRNKLDQFNWDPALINAAVREHWEAPHMNFVFNRTDKEGHNTTILSTSCHHTSPWIISTLLGLNTFPHIPHGPYQFPDNEELIIYNNVLHPRSTLPLPPIQSIRGFIDSRPLDEPVVILIDMALVLPERIKWYIDHHVTIHAYNGQIQLYQGWQDTFNILEWMGDAGSFQARYPMDQDTFFAHFETFLAHYRTKKGKIARENSIWAIFGLTGTLTRKIDEKGRMVVDDEVVGYLASPWQVILATYFPTKP